MFSVRINQLPKKINDFCGFFCRACSPDSFCGGVQTIVQFLDYIIGQSRNNIIFDISKWFLPPIFVVKWFKGVFQEREESTCHKHHNSEQYSVQVVYIFFNNYIPGWPVVSPQFPLAASGLHSTIPTAFVWPLYVTFLLQMWKQRKSVNPWNPETCKKKCRSTEVGLKSVSYFLQANHFSN